MPARLQAVTAATLVSALALAACAPAGPPVRGSRGYRPPPPLALVAILDPSPADAAAELRQLETVIEAGVTPSQTLVVAFMATGPAAGVQTVRAGDSLSSIAAEYGVPLAALQSANPQLGPLADRDWNRIRPGDRVTVPDAHAGSPARNAIVTRAPSGPPPPALVAEPARPANATTFQDAEYRRALAAARQANSDRVAAWWSAAGAALQPWRETVVRRLRELAGGGGANGTDGAGGDGDLVASVQAAANTLAGLPGRRVLLLMAGGRLGPIQGWTALPPLGGIEVVVANLPDTAGPAFAGAARAAGAAVTALDPVLTELQLAPAVNG